jgi:ryanodine receptor 2
MTYQPKPIDTSGIELPPGLADLQERLAEHAHDLWAAQRLADGWRLGPGRSDRLREHPGLVPYADLPESERAYDRVMAMKTIGAILALGYEVQPSKKLEQGSAASPLQREATSDPPLVVALRALVVRADGRALVLRRIAGSRHWPGQWELPGGAQAPGEAIDRTLQREVLEETGLQIRCERLVGAAEHDLGSLRLIVLAIRTRILDADASVRLSAEHDAFRWTSSDELAAKGIVSPQQEAIRSWIGAPP